MREFKEKHVLCVSVTSSLHLMQAKSRNWCSFQTTVTESEGTVQEFNGLEKSDLNWENNPESNGMKTWELRISTQRGHNWENNLKA